MELFSFVANRKKGDMVHVTVLPKESQCMVELEYWVESIDGSNCNRRYFRHSGTLEQQSRPGFGFTSKKLSRMGLAPPDTSWAAERVCEEKVYDVARHHKTLFFTIFISLCFPVVSFLKFPSTKDFSLHSFSSITLTLHSFFALFASTP